MNEYYVLVEPWAIYVKEKEFFESKGGLTEQWGQRWVLVHANSIEDARALYQSRVRRWVLQCFGRQIADDMVERSFRFLEEALELVQSVGCTKDQALALVDYVYNRPVGNTTQEVGGVLVTLHAFAAAAAIDAQHAGEVELMRVDNPETIAKIRRKQASKRHVVSHESQASLPGEWQ